MSVTRLRTSLPIFVADGLLSEAEVARMRQTQARLLREREALLPGGPLLCFQHHKFLEHRGLRRFFLRPDRREDEDSARCAAS